MSEPFQNPLQASNKEFQEFIFLLQDCLHDEGLFSPDEISKVETKLSMNNENQVARQRFLFFRKDICLTVDQTIHGGFGEDDYYRPQNNLRAQHTLVIAHAPLLRKRDYLNGKSSLHQIPRFRRLGILSSKSIDSSFLYLDLPDNLNLLMENLGRSGSNMQLLISILKFHLESMQRMSQNESLRTVDSINLEAGINQFRLEALNTYQTFYQREVELQNIQPWLDGYLPVDMKDGSQVLVYDEKSMGFSSKVKRLCPIPSKGIKFLFHSSGQLEIMRMLSSSMVTPDQFSNDEDMSTMAHNFMRFLQLLQKDIYKSANIIEFVLANGVTQSNV